MAGYTPVIQGVCVCLGLCIVGNRAIERVLVYGRVLKLVGYTARCVRVCCVG